MRFPKQEFKARVQNVRKAMSARRLEFLVVFSSPGSMRFGQRGHVLYLSGYEPYFGNTMLIFPQEDRAETLLQIDEARHFPSDCTWVSEVRNPQDPVKTIKEYLAKNGGRRARLGIAGDYSIRPMLLDRIRRELGDSRISLASDILEDARAVKSDFEIGCIRKACAIARKGFEAAVDFASPGVHDYEVVSEIERTCRMAGSEFFPHYTMFSSGNDTKYLELWWRCGKRRLRKKDTMLADFGTMYGSYCCDMARSFSMGPASDKHRAAYEVIVEAEKAAQKAARPGARASDVDRAAADVMKEFKGLITTGDVTDIGHGVGLEVHEWPFMGYHHIRNDLVYKDRELKENMVISIEPQIYHPELGLVQIEDQFAVRGGGGAILTDLPREILEC